MTAKEADSLAASRRANSHLPNANTCWKACFSFSPAFRPGARRASWEDRECVHRVPTDCNWEGVRAMSEPSANVSSGEEKETEENNDQ